MGETPTIRHVAAAAGVSVSTVSRVMNHVSSVAPDLTARVRSAADQLGYQPNPVARGLAGGRTGLIGVVVPDLTNPSFQGVLKGLNNAATAEGYGVVVADAEESELRELDLARRLLAQTDGLVLCSSRLPREQLQLLAEEARPIVLANRSEPGIRLPCVTVDEYEAALSLAGHLITFGHRRVAYLQGPALSWSNRERWRAFQDAASFGLLPQELLCGSEVDDGYAAADGLLALEVTAAVAFNDFVALGVLSGLLERNVDVPGDLSLASFDDIPFAGYVSPAMTTVRRPTVQLGRETWRALEAMLAGVAIPEPVALRGELILRSSVAKLERPVRY